MSTQLVAMTTRTVSHQACGRSRWRPSSGRFAGVPPLGALVTGPILAQRCRCRKLVAGPASSLPLERVDDPLARQRPGKLLLALPRGGAVDHWAGDVARGVAGRSVAGRRLLDLWREPDPALLRQHHLSLAGAPAARGGYSQAPRSCGDFRTDRGHLYAGVPGDAAGRVGMERPGSRLGSGASRVAAQALLPTSAALVLDRALRGHGVDGGRRRRTAGAEPARQRTDMARDGRGALHPRRSDLRGEMAEPRATGLRLPRGIPHLRAGRQHHALRVHDALRSAWGVGAASSARHSGSASVAVTRRSHPSKEWLRRPLHRLRSVHLPEPLDDPPFVLILQREVEPANSAGRKVIRWTS